MNLVILTQEELAAMHDQIADLRAKLAQAEKESVTAPRKPHHALTDAEMRILLLVAQGYCVEKIVKRLHIARRTAQSHLSSIYAKLGVTSRTQAAIYAWRNGIVDVDEAWETVKSLEWRTIAVGR